MFTAAFIFGHATTYRILVSQPVTEFVPSAVEVWSPNLWTAREFHVALLFFFKLCWVSIAVCRLL